MSLHLYLRGKVFPINSAIVVLALASLFCAGTPQCPAQSVAIPDPNDEFAIQTWTTEDGLPQNIVTDLFQTRTGYIWTGSYNGIAQFDGEYFRVFDSSHNSGLANSRIRSFFEDAQGCIWIGHDTADLTRYSKGKFEPVPIKTKWNGGPILGIQADHAGDVWIVDIRGEALRIRDGLLIQPPPEMAEDASLVPQVLLDGENRLLLVRNGYIAEITPAGYVRVDFQSPETRPYYSRVAIARSGGEWILGETDVRRRFHNQWLDDLGESPWGSSFVMAALESSSGRLFVGTLERGLFIHDPVSGWMNLNRSNGLPQDWVRCLTEDSEHNIWVGTSEGLVVLRPRSVVMRNSPDNWNGRPVLAITQTTDGSVWAGTEGAGLYRLNGNKWENYSVQSGLSNQFVWSVIEDSQKRIWAGTWGGGLFQLQSTNFVRQFEEEEYNQPVTALLEFPAGTIWVGTTAGLVRCRQDTLEHFSFYGGAAAGDVRALAVGTEGRIWLGTLGKGLGCLKGSELQTWGQADGLPSDFILSLYQEQDKRLWIGTLDKGLCFYQDGHFYSITTSHGLPSNNIGHIEDDGLGHLWFSSQQGLFRADKKQLIECGEGKTDGIGALAFGKAEGLAALAASSGFTPSGFRAADGRLWFPTARGIAIVNPKSVRHNSMPPHVWIEDILVDGQKGKLPPVNDQDYVSDGGARTVELKPGDRQLEVIFTGLSFTSPARVQFKYKLEGLDKDWTDCGTRRTVTYPFLPPGNYTFRVNACNNDGLWNNTGDAVGLVVLPFFWQTIWFKTIGGMACFGMVGGGAYLESRRRHSRKIERISHEHELERERTRIAQDIHDDVGASLTRIGMLSEAATEDLHDRKRAAASLLQIYATARDLTRAMDEIVWAVNPRHDTLESLTNYIARFAHDFLSAAHIRCRLDAPTRVPDVIVRSEIRHNLFLAFKETLNNAVKHSGATEVRVGFQFNPDSIALIVADNGSGFDPRTPPMPQPDRLVSGYGIEGIRNRLEQVGGRMEIQSRNGEGTTVIFTVFMPKMASVKKLS